MLLRHRLRLRHENATFQCPQVSDYSSCSAETNITHQIILVSQIQKTNIIIVFYINTNCPNRKEEEKQ